MEKRALPLKRALRAVLLVLLLGVAGMTKLQAQNIVFADANVKSRCVSNWDTDGDGELSYAEAAAVTSLGTVFKSKSNITTFDELQYFVGLTSIDNSAFYYCTGLTSIVIPNSVTSIGDQAFYSCYYLSSIEIPNSVTSIGNSTFCYCHGLTSIDIPNSVTSIGNSAFFDCSGLTSIEIPNSVVSIGNQAFHSCDDLEQIIVEAGNTIYDSRDNCNAIINSSTNELIIGCKNTIIPNTVTSIGEYAFYQCTGLTSIEIPNSVTSLGDYAFYYCIGLTSIEIPSSVVSLGDHVFSSCDGLTLVEIANSVTSIGDYAFSYCSDLTSIEIPNSVTSIGDYAFTGCLGLTSVEIPNSVTSIGNSVFYDCTGLTSVEIPNSVVSIGTFAFSNCSGLSSIEIPNSVTSIGNYAFHYCTGLTSVEIPNSVTSIGNSAFYYCTNLSSIEIPNSVTSIGNNAFYYCMALTSMTVWAENPPTLGSSAFFSIFSGEDKSLPVYVPCGSLEAYQNASGWNEFVNMFGMCSGEVAVTANPSEGGTVSGAGYYSEGDICVLTATSNPGFGFGNWTENGMVVSTDSVFSFPAHPTNIVANFYSDSPIVFADANVKALCVGNWDMNGDGELSYAEAAAVTNLGTVFENNASITSFDELQYFIGLTVIGDNAFSSCTCLTSVKIPESVTIIGNSAFSSCTSLTSVEIPHLVYYIGGRAFYDCHGLESITVLAENEPWLEGEWVNFVGWNEWGGWYSYAMYLIEVFSNVDKSIPVYVPCGSLESYQYNGWNEFTNVQEMGCPVYGITATANPMGGGTVTGGGEYTQGTTCTLTAAPNVGYIFLNWTKDGEEVSTEATYSFTVTEDATLVANFEVNIITQTTALAYGWNWYSTYIEQEGIDGLGQLENSIGIPNARIESQDGDYVRSKVRNGRTVWVGALTSINNEEMYKIGTKTACIATMEGIATDPALHPITINRGWNWIGFPCDHSVSVNEAMSGFSPKKNDMIKGRNGSATYSNGTWSGTLNTLEPGQGYMYGSKSNVTKTLVFQTGNRGEAILANITPENNYYQPAEDYADNMTVIAVVELDGEELRSDNYELAALAGDECRGSVKLMYVEAINRYVAFLTVFGDEADDLHFVLTDGATSDLSADYITYATDGIEGSLDEPVVLRFGFTNVNENASVNVKVYPNPSQGIFNIEGSNIKRVEVFNALGQPVCSMETENGFLKLDLTNRPSGVYLIRVVTADGVKSHQVMKR